MSFLNAAGITVGLLAALWVYGSGLAGISAFVGFFGWASYYAAGGGKDGSVKALCSNLSGVFWGLVVVRSLEVLPESFRLIVIAVAAAVMCWQANITLLSFIPGTFIGNACFYANEGDWQKSTVGLICGVALGLVSEYSARALSTLTTKKEEPAKNE